MKRCCLTCLSCSDGYCTHKIARDLPSTSYRANLASLCCEYYSTSKPVQKEWELNHIPDRREWVYPDGYLH